MRSPSTRTDRRDAGFTLLEMIVVLVIVGLAAAIVGARTGNVTPQVQLRTSVQKLTADLRIARADAMRRGVQETVTIDATSRSYWGGDRSRATQLPPALVVRVASSDLVSEGTGPRETAGPLKIVFAPDGSSSGGRIDLTAGNAMATVTVDWLTGVTRVGWGRVP